MLPHSRKQYASLKVAVGLQIKCWSPVLISGFKLWYHIATKNTNIKWWTLNGTLSVGYRSLTLPRVLFMSFFLFVYRELPFLLHNDTHLGSHFFSRPLSLCLFSHFQSNLSHSTFLHRFFILCLTPFPPTLFTFCLFSTTSSLSLLWSNSGPLPASLYATAAPSWHPSLCRINGAIICL